MATNSDDPDATPRLHVLQMGTQFGMGGITRHILGLRDWLRDNGHRVTLAGTPDVWGGPDIDPEFLTLPTRYVAEDGGAIPARLTNAAKAAWSLRRWLQQNSVDVIHCHESAPALVAQLARIGYDLPLAVTYHGSEPERVAAFGRIARKCDLVITPSHHSANDLAVLGGVPKDRLMVLGLGVAKPPDQDHARVAALRANLLGDGERLIVTIARLIHQKGIDILIDCVGRMKETHPSYRFVVAGNGPDEAVLHEIAREKGVLSQLTFVGRTEEPHLYLHAADLFLLTSRWEALPFTIVESFQAATPAVATACSGVVELIDEHVGAVAPIGDVDAICAAVATVLADESRLAAMSDAALERSRESRFDPDWVHRQFESLYCDIARKGRT